MFGKFLRFSALLAAPLALAGAAQADQYDDRRDGERAALILFSGENFGGDVREVFETVAALPDLRFNDRARSVAVLEGQWEVCEHSDFTGKCVFIRHDVENLRRYNLNRKISSVRPIFEYTDAEHGLMFRRDRNGYIRYADNDQYGYDDHNSTYGVSNRVNVYHYGTSHDYGRFGYYNPHLGHGPYGYNYGRNYSSSYGHRGYSNRGYRRERPLRGHYGARDGAVTVYTDGNQRGASLGLNRAVSDLSRLRFNDNVSSINIRSGQWEVCEHANFRGRCEVIDASTGRLSGLRLNDNISSIRPAGTIGHTGRANRTHRGVRRGRRGDHNGNAHPRRDRRRVESLDNNVQDRVGPALMGGVNPVTRGAVRGVNRARPHREAVNNRRPRRSERLANAAPAPVQAAPRAARMGNGRSAIQAPRRQAKAAPAPVSRPAPRAQAPRQQQPRREARPNPRSPAGIRNRDRLE